jgi:hypothetical protein
MKKILLQVLVGAILLHVIPALADDGFYVVAGGGGVGTRITSVPYTIGVPGAYYLGRNLSYAGTSDGIAIAEGVINVTLDLMGFSISGSGSGTGISMTGSQNVEIRNGTVRGWNYGIFESGAGGLAHRIINVRAEGNTQGIRLYGNGHLIKGCNASNNTNTGLYLDSGMITDCVASNNGTGLNGTGLKLAGPGNVLGNAVFNNKNRNLDLGNGVATAIMVDRNSAFGLNPNYYVIPNTTGVQWGINAGAP